MENKLTITYTPEQIDEAVKQHILNTTGYTGATEITYTHKRTLKKVSAEITLSDPVHVSLAEKMPTLAVSDKLNRVGFTSVLEMPEDKVVAETLNNDTGEFEPSSLTAHEAVHIGDPIPDGNEDLSLNEQKELDKETEEITSKTQGVTQGYEKDPECEIEVSAELEEHVSEELRKESREADSEIEIPEDTESELDDLGSLFPNS